jgi:predicted Zn-dependent protease
VGDFYAKLLRMEKDAKAHRTPLLSGLSDALSTHPPSDERVQQMRELSSSVALSRKAITSTKDFDRVRKICQDWVRVSQDRAQS